MVKHVLRLLLASALLCAIVLFPVNSSTEDTETTLLARTIYAMAGDEDYDTQLAVGSVLMNRVASGSFPNTLDAVLAQNFPCGDDFNETALNAARECMNGKRTVPGYVLYMKREDSPECWNSSGFFKQEGQYQFFTNI